MSYKINNKIRAVCEVKINYSSKIKPSERPDISCPAVTYRLLTENAVFDPSTIEHREFFKILLLNNANKLLGISHLSEGSINGTVVDVRHIMQIAILANACKLIICHNHPSGNIAPSQEDDNRTLKIKNACCLMDITLADHLIISSENYYSYADNGRLL
jgi:DNA repair protein RadC